MIVEPNINWKSQETRIAVADKEGVWQYYTFDSWDEAREAINKAREESKTAVFYDGATLPYPPDFCNESETLRD